MVTKLTLPSKENAVQEKVNEIIDNLGGGYSEGTGIDISNNTISVDNTVAMKTDIPTVNNATLTITQGGTSKGTFTANASSDVTIDLDAGGGASRNVGEIIQSTIPLTDAGLHLLDGSLISGSGSYSDFVTYIAGLVSDYPDLFTTEANWQSAVTTYGVCGKFVYDSTNQTVRLPKYGDKVWTSDIASTAAVFGNGKALQLTNGTVTGSLANYTSSWNSAYGNGFIVSQTPNANVGQGSQTGQNVSAQTAWGIPQSGESGLIADLSNITTALDGYWYIVIATSTKTQIEVDIDEIATDLNGKADVDLSNINSSGKDVIINTSTPNGSMIGTVLTVGTPYTATVTGEYYLFGCVSSTARTIYVNDYAIGELGGSGWSREMITLNLRVGDVVNLTTSFNDLIRFTLNWRGK